MYKIKYYNKHTETEEVFKYLTLMEAVHHYLELRALAWWEFDFKNLTIYNYDGQDITQVLDDFLDGRNKKHERVNR